MTSLPRLRVGPRFRVRVSLCARLVLNVLQYANRPSRTAVFLASPPYPPSQLDCQERHLHASSLSSNPTSSIVGGKVTVNAGDRKGGTEYRHSIHAGMQTTSDACAWTHISCESSRYLAADWLTRILTVTVLCPNSLHAIHLPNRFFDASLTQGI